LAAKFKLKTQRKVFTEYGKNLQGNDKIAFVEPVYKISPWDFKFPSNKLVDPKISDSGILKTLYAESISVASLEDLVCSMCGSNYRVEMHHVRFLKDLNSKLSKIDALMAKRQRKQIALCKKCHMNHHGSSKNKHTSS
jgi:hypothetical protein